MCGILGLFGTPWQTQARTLLDSIATRGPDGRAVLELEDAVLGHTRLAVIDVASGQQPMRAADGRYAIVFNGEIYNYRALRRELEQQGYRFLTHSDTEVLLHGYAHWGRALLERLDGIFAFALWDTQARTLFAARDRMGVKPFFYSAHNGLVIASTLEPFFQIDGFPRRLDYEALRDYLAFQTVLAPHTFLREVRQLPPASWLSYDASHRRIDSGRYWTIPTPADRAPPFEELVQRIDSAVARSVERQLVADVPLGAFLSGGIDSSLMVHYMAQAGARPLKTFSMRFHEQGFDETTHALAVAQQYGTEHHVIDAPDIGADQLAAAIHALDQPLADPAYVTTAELSRLTKQHVTVAISGDGGDELFGGYPRFLDQDSDHPARAWRAALHWLIERKMMPGSLLRRSLSGQDLLFYRKVELGPYASSRKSMAQYLSPAAWPQCHGEKTLGLWTQLIHDFGGRMDTASLMRADLWTYLSENCLMKTDRASMAHGLEVRVPLLGNDVLDAVLTLPASAHFDPDGKTLLRALARKYLPEQVWNRPKHGFSVPLNSYFNGPWRRICEDHLSRIETLAPFLDAGAIRKLWHDARTGRASKRLIYTFIVLLIWLDRHELSP